MEQANELVMYHLGLSQAEVDELDDEAYVEQAARAYFLEDRRALAVKRGLLMAVGEMFRK